MLVHSLSKKKILGFLEFSQFAADLMQEAIDAHQLLDSFSIPRKEEGEYYSLAERVEKLVERSSSEGKEG